jgi:hypothetical protein
MWKHSFRSGVLIVSDATAYLDKNGTFYFRAPPEDVLTCGEFVGFGGTLPLFRGASAER